MTRRRAVAATILVIALAALLVAWRAGYFDATRLENIRRLVHAGRELPFGLLLFAAAHVLAIVLLLPTTPVSVAGGALFGMSALPVVWVAALVGSAAAFALGRYTGRFPMRRFLANHPMLERLRSRASTWDMVRLRVLPFAPFGVLNYLAGMSGIRLRTLLVATAVGMLPSTVAYVAVGRQLAIALEGGRSAREAIAIAAAITMALALMAAVTGAARIARARRK